MLLPDLVLVFLNRSPKPCDPPLNLLVSPHATW